MPPSSEKFLIICLQQNSQIFFMSYYKKKDCVSVVTYPEKLNQERSPFVSTNPILLSIK